MCLIAVALDAHPRYALVLAANRDEFHARPTAPASYWDDAPQLFGGRDLQRHGSWLACSRDGRWAAVTNVRRMEPPDVSAPTRGRLVADYLRGMNSAEAYAATLERDAARYAGFNLLLGDRTGVWYASNWPGYTMRKLEPGVHAVSNASLDTPWPKLVRLKRQVQRWCDDAETDFAPLLSALADPREASDEELPDTGIGAARERFLSPPFIRGVDYGTRSSTLLAIDGSGHASFLERRFGPEARFLGETSEYLRLG